MASPDAVKLLRLVLEKIRRLMCTRDPGLQRCGVGCSLYRRDGMAGSYPPSRSDREERYEVLVWRLPADRRALTLLLRRSESSTL
jgi:hypothetical protein